MAVRRPLAWLVRLTLVLVVASLLFEGAVRLLLFDARASGLSVAAALRQPTRLGYAENDDEWWLLRQRFADPDRVIEPPKYDPVLGWRGMNRIQADYDHGSRENLNGRRPVLLYGDSFIQCLTSRGECWEGLLEGSPFAAEHCAINYGVGGYGLDQIYLLLDLSLERWVELNPVVVIGILVEEDLGRCRLSFRGWPKPRLEIRGGQLVAERSAVPTMEELSRELGATSYGLRLLRGAKGAGAQVDVEAYRALTHRILEETVELLRARELEHFFLLFNTEGALAEPERLAWHGRALVADLDALGAPWVSTRGLLEAELQAGRSLAELFDETGHLSPLGNHLSFQALANGLRGTFDGAPGTPVPTVAGIERVVLNGKRAEARYECGVRPQFPDPRDVGRLCVRVGRGGPSEVHYRLDGQVGAFRARARLIGSGGSVGLTLLADGEVVFPRQELAADGELVVRADLTGRRELTIEVDDAGDGVRGDSVALVGARFETAD
jgi:hypothetical protein